MAIKFMLGVLIDVGVKQLLQNYKWYSKWKTIIC